MKNIQVELQSFMGDDRAIAEAAWTSSTTKLGKSNKTEEDVARLVRMLIQSKHASPIESVIMRFWIKMPIQTDRQHMSHRIASHNGMSGRYRTMPSEWAKVPEDIEQLLTTVYGDHKEFTDEYERLCNEANEWYRDQLGLFKRTEDHGLLSNSEYKRLREFFRGVLPQNNMTERVTIMNLRSFANYQKLRSSPHAQPEIREVARQMLEQVKQNNVAPIAVTMLESVGWEI